MAELQNKVVLVTGAARGIGRAIAEAAAREGATVVATDLTVDLLADTAAALAEAGAPHLALAHDVTDRASSEAVLAAVLEAHGRVDVLVNNAGVAKAVLFMDLTEAEWDRQNDVNAKGTFLVSQVVAGAMIEAGSGRIVNISSIGGREGFVAWAAYNASKHAVTALTQVMAKELGKHDITVNAVCPGAIKTFMWDPEVQGEGLFQSYEEFVTTTPLGRGQTPGDVAETVSFLASDRARNITGQSINVSSGAMMH